MKHTPAISLPDQISKEVKSRAKGKAFLGFALYALISCSIATEFLAWKLQFSSALTKESLIGKLYYPWAVFQWGYRFATLHGLPSNIHNEIIRYIAESSLLLLTLLIVALILALADHARHIASAPPVHHTEGSANWIEFPEIYDLKVIPPKNATETQLREFRQSPGVYLGIGEDEKGAPVFWRDVSDEHLILNAPTRSGKGVSFCVTTCLSWNESLVVNDPKTELFNLTAHFRKHVLKQRIFRIDLLCTDGTATRINPLDWIRLRTEHEVDDAQNVAKMVTDPLGLGLETGGSEDHWRKTSYAFLTGVILHILYDPTIRDKSLTGLDSYLSAPNRPLLTTLDMMVKAEHDPNLERGWLDYRKQPTPTCPTVAVAAQDMLNKHENERNSVMSSLKSYFELYRSPIVSRNIAVSDFSLEDLMRSDRPATLYLNSDPENMERLRPFMRLLNNAIVTRFTQSLEFKDGRPVQGYNYRLLMLMDEFTSTLGKLPIFTNAISFLAGYGIKLFIVVQNLTQLSGTYDEKTMQTILANMRTQIYYASNDQDTMQRISKMLGDRTIRTESKSYGGDGKPSTSEGFRGRPLMTPDEVRRFNPSKEIVIITGHAPAILDRIVYYKIPLFSDRVEDPKEPDGSPIRCDIIPYEQRAATRAMQPLLEQAKLAAQERKLEIVAVEPMTLSGRFKESDTGDEEELRDLI